MQSLISHLLKIKKLGVIAIKQSLEDEGASFEDIKKMRAITSIAKLKLNVKVGGCEAKNDIFFCKKIGVDGIVAPMVESQYALQKFIQTVGRSKKNSLYVNLESQQAFTNIKKIMKNSNFNLLRGVVVGRSDLAGSLGLEKSAVDSKLIYNKVFNLLTKIKKRKLWIKMGGSVTPNSQAFVYKLFKKKLIDSIETRNAEILLNKRNIFNLKDIIINIYNFELKWLKYKLKNTKPKNFELKKNDCSSRIKEISNRIILIKYQ